MSILTGLAQLRAAYRRAQRNAEAIRVLNALPPELQKDIGWRWTPRLRGTAARSPKVNFDLL